MCVHTHIAFFFSVHCTSWALLIVVRIFIKYDYEPIIFSFIKNYSHLFLFIYLFFFQIPIFKYTLTPFVGRHFWCQQYMESVFFAVAQSIFPLAVHWPIQCECREILLRIPTVVKDCVLKNIIKCSIVFILLYYGMQLLIKLCVCINIHN